jgi:predicted nucleotidyltransferase
MREFPSLEIGRIAVALHERLGAAVQAAYLYGSASRGCRHARDLDLLLVIGSKDQTAVFAAIAEIQSRNRILIHPTVVSPRELQSNPLFRELVDSATVLWQKL